MRRAVQLPRSPDRQFLDIVGADLSAVVACGAGIRLATIVVRAPVAKAGFLWAALSALLRTLQQEYQCEDRAPSLEPV